jgi:uncharacterized membrane protein
MLKKALDVKKLIVFLVLGLAIGQAFAQYEIKKYTINSGGSKMSGGSYEMNSSIGQADAGGQLSGGNYSLNGGFWHENNDLIFKSGFE